MRVELARGAAGIVPGNVVPESGESLSQFERILPIGASGKPTGILAIGPPMRKIYEEQEQLLFALLEIAATALDSSGPTSIRFGSTGRSTSGFRNCGRFSIWPGGSPRRPSRSRSHTCWR